MLATAPQDWIPPCCRAQLLRKSKKEARAEKLLPRTLLSRVNNGRTGQKLWPQSWLKNVTALAVKTSQRSFFFWADSKVEHSQKDWLENMDLLWANRKKNHALSLTFLDREIEAGWKLPLWSFKKKKCRFDTGDCYNQMLAGCNSQGHFDASFYVQTTLHLLHLAGK